MISDYSHVNRVNLFKELTYDELKKEIDEQKFEDIIFDKYDEFVAFCTEIESNKSAINSVSCEYIDGELMFDIKYK